MRRWLSLPLIIALLSTTAPGRLLQAQRVSLDAVITTDTALRHSVRLRDGTVLVGRIVSITADSVRTELETGVVAVPRSAIVEVNQFPASRLRSGRYWPENPHGTRLLFSPTAIPIEQGTGYYSNTWLFLNAVAVGLTDRLSLGVGFTLIPGVNFFDNLFYLLPKYTLVDRPFGRLAVGGLLGSVAPGFGISFGDGGDDDEVNSGGILYVVGSRGDRDNNVSLGAGWGYLGTEISNTAVVMAGFQRRVSRRVSIISENWFAPTTDADFDGLWSLGFRFLGESVAVDLALVNSVDDPFFPGVPWLGFAFRF